ncbi:hypothetical protein AK830_g12673 [Neonectria ditissima]|uniref:UFSP1/2/DUB catalytic domain-containing protein n=1 Tax=Neonectria ditissima TaxID=78410 RepID=A0A0P7AZY8_9HYPO|nr:hypothetical protein AK830_g12673 [Neonectria ditissima]
MTSSGPTPKCPFCGLKTSGGEYELLLHIETRHPDGQSPFSVADEPISCPQDGCGETVPQDELPYHLELHDLEARDDVADALDQPSASPATAGKEPDRAVRDSTHKRQREKQSSTIQAWKALFGGPKPRHNHESSHRTRHKAKRLLTTESSLDGQTSGGDTHSAQHSQRSTRLGKSELGRFAHEHQMPPWLVDLLQQEGQVINDGGFCGYRNIQMLVSHIIGARSTGAELFGATFPTIFEIQDLIENAWDNGFNAQGRVETGGVKGTRKYIGTPEVIIRVQLLPALSSTTLTANRPKRSSVVCQYHKERGKAKTLLLEGIEQYFQGGVEDVEARIHLTGLPPIYLQHPGHSLTIVGIERQMDGELNLLVFDPSFHDSTKIKHLVGKAFRHKLSTVDQALQPYRRDARYLRKYSEFETL